MVRALSFLFVLLIAPASALLAKKSDPCPFGYGCGGSNAPMTSATRDEVARLLGGILTKLQSKKGLVETSGVVTKVEAVNEAPAPDEAPMAAPVKLALQAIVSSMQHDDSQASLADAFQEMLASAHPDQFTSQRRPIDAATKANVAGILEGILKNLSSHK